MPLLNRSQIGEGGVQTSCGVDRQRPAQCAPFVRFVSDGSWGASRGRFWKIRIFGKRKLTIWGQNTMKRPPQPPQQARKDPPKPRLKVPDDLAKIVKFEILIFNRKNWTNEELHKLDKTANRPHQQNRGRRASRGQALFLLAFLLHVDQICQHLDLTLDWSNSFGKKYSKTVAKF